MKRMARDFQSQFNEALREAELDDVRKDVEAIGKGLSQEVAKAGPASTSGADIRGTDASPRRRRCGAAADAAPAAETPATAAAPADAGRAGCRRRRSRPAAARARSSRDRQARQKTRSRRAARRCSIT